MFVIILYYIIQLRVNGLEIFYWKLTDEAYWIHLVNDQRDAQSWDYIDEHLAIKKNH